MKHYDSIIQDLQNSMREIPSSGLREKILASAAHTAPEPPTASALRRITARPLLVAAIIIALTITTAFAAYLPEFVRRINAGNMTVTQYEPGQLPLIEPALFSMSESGDGIVVFRIDGVTHSDGNTEYAGYAVFDSLEAARETFGPFLLPTYFRYGEISRRITVLSHANGQPDTLVIPFHDTLNWYRGTVSNFILWQTYIGDSGVYFDTDREVVEFSVNGHDAIWNDNLHWVQDGFLITLSPPRIVNRDRDLDCGFPEVTIDREYALRIAESLQPMR
ncbi:MAG: hypothetical protein FWB96_05860 [Defluviitaleaceae bacterium]|nr:hypothetical protein [Defluviitaleaceae bacterium]MCL2262304.1 hypothetical protein [Defluviitaleaceae bacterium]